VSAPEGIYRRVSVRLWSDARVRQLSPLRPSGCALWLYLLTGPHTTAIPGVFVTGSAAMAEALGWKPADLQRALRELIDAGMVEFDEPSRLWFIPRAIRHNPPPNPNVVRGWRTQWSLLPEGPIRDSVGQRIRAELQEYSEPCAKAFEEVAGKTSENHSRKPFDKSSGAPSPKQEQQAGEQQAGTEGIPSDADASAVPAAGRAVDDVFGLGLQLLVTAKVPEEGARTFLGLLRSEHGNEAVAAAVRVCAAQRPAVSDPKGYLRGLLKRKAAHTGFAAKDYSATVDGGLHA